MVEPMKTLQLQKTPRHFVSSATFAAPLFTAIVEETRVLKILVEEDKMLLSNMKGIVKQHTSTELQDFNARGVLTEKIISSNEVDFY